MFWPIKPTSSGELEQFILITNVQVKNLTHSYTTKQADHDLNLIEVSTTNQYDVRTPKRGCSSTKSRASSVLCISQLNVYNLHALMLNKMSFEIGR